MWSESENKSYLVSIAAETSACEVLRYFASISTPKESANMITRGMRIFPVFLVGIKFRVADAAACVTEEMTREERFWTI